MVIKDILLEKAPPKHKIFRNKFNIKATRFIFMILNLVFI